jgi:hypothetical protein
VRQSGSAVPGGLVTVTVGGDGSPVLLPAACADGGRGMRLVDALAA